MKGADGISRSTYSEKLLIGYRWYQEKNIEPLFPFGYGQSYTSFAFSDLTVTPAGDGATVSVKVKNTGSRAGAEVAQVYVEFPASAGEPPLQLKGFDKVSLQPGAVLDRQHRPRRPGLLDLERRLDRQAGLLRHPRRQLVGRPAAHQDDRTRRRQLLTSLALGHGTEASTVSPDDVLGHVSSKR